MATKKMPKARRGIIAPTVKVRRGHAAISCSNSQSASIPDPISGYVPEDIHTRNLLADPELSGRIVAKSDQGDFIACASLGALRPGHILILPVFKATSIAKATELISTERDYEAFAASLRGMLGDVFQVPIIEFEHGMGLNSCSSSCGTTHGHRHMVPLDLESSMLNLVSDYIPEWSKIGGVRELQQIIMYGYDYLTFTDRDGDEYVHMVSGTSDAVTSQFFRRVICKSLGKPGEWDWQAYPKHEDVRLTCEVFHDSPSEVGQLTGDEQSCLYQKLMQSDYRFIPDYA